MSEVQPDHDDDGRYDPVPRPGRRKDALFVTDEEMIRRLGAPRKAASMAIRMLDRDRSKGFPRKQKLWGNRRYWPAVRAWFDRQYMVTRSSWDDA